MRVILLFFCILIIGIVLSKIKINIKQLELNSSKLKSANFKVMVGLYLFGKIRIIWITIDNNKIKKLDNIKLPIKLKIPELKIDKELIKLRKKVKFNIEEFNLKLNIDTENVFIQTYLVVILSTLLSIILFKTVRKSNAKIYYNIQPLYQNKNSLDLNLTSIISIKLVHIINMSFDFIKKVRCDKNERMSNRRSYEYSHE